ncbi:hypothetical protein GCM10007285_12050 [Stappia taiwanensis]|nr:hypothetical protein GCM10007285_12050 [Stappia taiwanensis]
MNNNLKAAMAKALAAFGVFAPEGGSAATLDRTGASRDSRPRNIGDSQCGY